MKTEKEIEEMLLSSLGAEASFRVASKDSRNTEDMFDMVLKARLYRVAIKTLKWVLDK